MIMTQQNLWNIIDALDKRERVVSVRFFGLDAFEIQFNTPNNPTLAFGRDNSVEIVAQAIFDA
jgi:hypothetical protein